MADYSYLRMTVPPGAEPLHLTEVKNHLRVTETGDDTLITNLIKAARQYCEAVQGRAYVCRTYEMAFDDAYPEVIYPPHPPLVSVSGITYLDSDGTAQTESTANYTVDDDASPPRIFEAYNKTWSTVGRAIENAIKVTYISGYCAPFTIANVTEILTVSGRTFTNGDTVRVWNSGGALPDGLSASTVYYVISVAGATCQLSLTEGGAAVTVDDDGTGTQYIQPTDKELPEAVRSAILLIVGHLYENRENSVEANLQTIPLGAKMLLQTDRVNW